MKYSWLLGALLLLSVSATAAPQSGIAMHGKPKYTANFQAFDYVNPDAPKGGTLKQAAIGSFDTFNPFVINGVAAAGIGLTYDTLMKQSADEPFSLYALIAESIEIDTQRHRVIFKINPKARFSDNTPITPEDVVFSFNILKEKGLPTYRAYYQDVLRVEATETDVIFYINPQVSNRELPLILGELPVLSKAWWQDKDFTKTILTPPISSGPYLIDTFEAGKFISYRLNPSYWAKDLNVNRGYYNFDTIRYDYYRDATVAIEAFKAGLFDVRMENEAKKWVTFQDMKEVQEGQIIMRSFEHHMPRGMQGFVFNTRRAIFQDPRVRAALAYAFDFNWLNTNLFYGLYRRTNSFFENSSLKATGLPTPAEKKLLEPWRDTLPPEVFTTPYTAPQNKGNIRWNLEIALKLLNEAKWFVRQGKLVNEKNEPFTFEILLDAPSAAAWERIVLPFVGQLKRLGIEARIRIVDAIQYKNRLDNFDYDMIVFVWGQSLSPGNEQRYFWGSQSALTHGSWNFSGIQNPAVDALIEAIVQANSQEELETAVHALDRVLLWSHLVIPHWHTPYQSFIYWNRFDMPQTTPMKGMDLLTWWKK